ncbi:SDR family NAD(P)-dependent oxidoreductase [Serratia rhizosphaerae]|uniref:SDR family oxidoreductase n=1 Tax=Serratia rhizosphaerae TaxID=2597702 RepID=A0ABX6GP37_9GAMM|nr:3-oxoacyl-ACP reductase FabG [Serratia rhizosphaerae]QHA88053.1 SDR family oxidoreductase [Serratia rhizosphaerae]
MRKGLFEFKDKVAVVTGGSKGIGLSIAKGLLEFGAEVWLLDTDVVAGEQAVHDLGSKTHFYQLDVTDPAAVKVCAEQVAKESGHIDMLVNCAGISCITPAFEAEDDEWRLIMDVNLNGTFWCCREFGRQMAKQQSGSIVNMGSMSGDIVNRPQAATAYITSKAGVHLMTKSLACEWVKDGIRVNALAPGYIATDMTLQMRSRPELFDEWMNCTPMKRCGEPDEVANAALFLVSDAASYITGTILAVDGGYTAW